MSDHQALSRTPSGACIPKTSNSSYQRRRIACGVQRQHLLGEGEIRLDVERQRDHDRIGAIRKMKIATQMRQVGIVPDAFSGLA